MSCRLAHLGFLTGLLHAAATTATGAELPRFASPEYLERYLPEKTPYTHICGCARLECEAYNKAPFMTWDRNEPDRVTCTACRTPYPSDEFPEDASFEVDGRSYAYHEDAKGKQHHFSGRAAYHRVIRALYDARYAAQDYGKSADAERGRQARDILLRFADVYPGWFYARAPTMTPGAKPYFPDVPGNAGAGRLKQYFGDYGFPSFFCAVYEPLAAGGLLTNEERGRARGLLADCVGQCVLPYFRLYRLTGNTAGQIFTDLVRTGKAFPDLEVHDLVHEHHFEEERILRGADLVHVVIHGPYGIANLLANGFHPDGFWHEGSLSYQSMVLHGLVPCLRELRGYSDPPDYRPPDPAWQRLDGFRPVQWTALRRALFSLPLLALPDGGILPLGDSHKQAMILPDWQKTLGDLAPPDGFRVPVGSAFHDGIGVAALRCGQGPNATAAFLTYGPRGGGHSHYDQLSLTYYSLGHELATDIGYPGSTDPLRHTWWNRTASHNTVVVDGQNQRQSLGRVVAYAAGPRFRVVQARCGNAYPQLDDYRRTLVLVGDAARDDAPRYLVDVFHVVGGSVHDYCFHGQSEPEMAQALFASEGVALAAVADESKTLLDFTPGCAPKTMGYDYVDHIRHGTASRPWHAEWRIPDEADTRLRLTRLPADDEQVFVGQASGHRVYPGHAKLDIGKKMTWLCARRAGTSPARSAFAGLVQAYGAGATLMSSLRRLRVSAEGTSDAVALEVAHGHGTDVIVVSRTAGERVVVAERDLRFDGRVAAVSLDPAGRPYAATVVEGEELVLDDFRLTVPATRAGDVALLPEGVSERHLVLGVNGAVPTAAVGHVLTLAHTNGTGSAWTVRSVDPGTGERTRVTLDRSALEGRGRVGRLSEDGRTLFCNSGFHRLEKDMCELFYGGMWLGVGEQRRQIESVTMHGRAEPFLWEVELRAPLPDPPALTGRQFVLSRVAVGDRFTIPGVAHWPAR